MKFCPISLSASGSGYLDHRRRIEPWPPERHGSQSCRGELARVSARIQPKQGTGCGQYLRRIQARLVEITHPKGRTCSTAQDRYQCRVTKQFRPIRRPAPAKLVDLFKTEGGQLLKSGPSSCQFLFFEQETPCRLVPVQYFLPPSAHYPASSEIHLLVQRAVALLTTEPFSSRISAVTSSS